MHDDVPVLIVGGSLVGLSSSLLLASKGVTSLTVERHPGTAIHPRAAMFNQRTIEIYRSLGLEPEIIEASGLEFEQDGAIVSVEDLAGKPFGPQREVVGGHFVEDFAVGGNEGFRGRRGDRRGQVCAEVEVAGHRPHDLAFAVVVGGRGVGDGDMPMKTLLGRGPAG